MFSSLSHVIMLCILGIISGLVKVNILLFSIASIKITKTRLSFEDDRVFML